MASTQRSSSPTRGVSASPMRDDPTRAILWSILLFCAAVGAALLAAGLAAGEQRGAADERLLGLSIGDLKPVITAK